MNVIDSSAWIEYFSEGKNWRHFEKAIKDDEHLLIPTIILYEVFKKILHEYNESKALQYVAQMQRGLLVDLDMELSIQAAIISQEQRLAMADSIILATAQKYGAIIWTQDSDFQNIKGVQYFKKVL